MTSVDVGSACCLRQRLRRAASCRGARRAACFASSSIIARIAAASCSSPSAADQRVRSGADRFHALKCTRVGAESAAEPGRDGRVDVRGEHGRKHPALVGLCPVARALSIKGCNAGSRPLLLTGAGVAPLHVCPALGENVFGYVDHLPHVQWYTPGNVPPKPL